MEKEALLKIIRNNIQGHGYHLNIVSSPTEPRYAYSIGFHEKFGFELIFAGGLYYLEQDLFTIFDNIKSQIEGSITELGSANFETDLGTFSLQNVDTSWSKIMGLGAFDYYQNKDIVFFQVLPDEEHHTLEIPDMSIVRSHDTAPIWKWLDKEWDLPVPIGATVATNIEVLFGDAVTELMRWEEDEWEMFSIPGPDVEEEATRIVSIATLISIDPTLNSTITIEVGKGLWREDRDSEWQNWG
ncbi:DUF4262 domain-containing protein [Pedobacter xixiisoli]|uniref:DUF4262 domain-containing protein n=1 Tax=Pedobacter xixiisoli TaxID=1476464 RepID=A0A286A784_9SPHI|nr:DUF4262 domain-containing protein [Pedobacter xixiisoli]SOD17747.1 protein of unknown function [Pedobacter xixiisoli]